MATDTTRVTSWDGYIGQEVLKARLRVHIDAALQDVRPMDHVLLAAGAGFGKTSLAQIIALELGARFERRVLPITEKAIREIVMECDSYGEYCVLLLDEIHAASKKEQEFLQPLLEFGELHDKRGHVYVAKNLTVVGATTEADHLVKPLYDRFRIRPPFDPYTDEEVTRILLGMAQMVGIELCDETAATLAQAAGGVPRGARDFIVAARDLARTLRRPATAEEILTFLRVDEDGLTYDHYVYLRTLDLMGGSSGIAGIKTVMRLPDSAVRDLELLLLQREMIELASNGRTLLPKGARKISRKRRDREAI